MSRPGTPERRIWRDTRADADDEIAYHLEMRERDFRERGMSAEAARAEALRRFGSIDTITPVGRAHLRDEATVWMRYAGAVTQVLRAAPAIA